MTQKILAGRADKPDLAGELVRVKVDQVVLAREPNRTLAEAAALGAKKCGVEVAVAYDGRCVTRTAADHDQGAPDGVVREALAWGVLAGRPGIGFPAPVHLERFASPARLALTDDPRLSPVAGVGMLTLTASPSVLAEALVHGAVWLRPPRSVQVLLSGRIRPFVCVRDVALELLRRGLGEVVQKVDRAAGAPVVLEFAGASARLLSVPERAVLAGMAPAFGAAGALFMSDEKTEVYLRDQRRSKAHRSLSPDPGAPCDAVLSVDLSAVDPLVMDDQGVVRPVRELGGKPVVQAVLGGDGGVTLRDLLAAAALLKSKRVPPRLDLLLAAPSRQALEVLTQAGALGDLIATGARVVEPDHRLLDGALYPPPPGGVSLRSFDPEPGTPPGWVVASAETIAYAVATGALGDPRSFKRPVRVTVPRALPTDDVLVLRKGGKAKGKAEGDPPKGTTPPAPPATHWTRAESLRVARAGDTPSGPSLVVARSLADVRRVARRVGALTGVVRAVAAPFIPSDLVAVFSGQGVLALAGEHGGLETLAKAATVELDDPRSWDGSATVNARAGDTTVPLAWLATGAERDWTVAGSARGPRR